MRITSRRRGSCTSVDLSRGHWRLGVAETPTTAGAGLGLVLRWPADTPAFLAAMPGTQLVPTDGHARWALAVAEVSIAKSPAELAPTALIALDNGSLEADITRVEEAMSLFRNLPRFREETLKADTANVVSLIRAYWQITDWVLSAERQPFSLVVGDAALMVTP